MYYDVIVIGAGIVGLSVAHKIKQLKPNLKVLIIDKEAEVATHQSGHNSGVIHSGIYYKPESLKAINCKKGYDQLIQFCETYDIAYELCGKIIVATQEQEFPQLENIYRRGQKNGLKDICEITAEQIKEREPFCNGIKGVFVPQTGIVDYKQVAKKILELFEAKGGEIVYSQEVKNIVTQFHTNIVETNKASYKGRLLINCAGLHSDRITKITNPEEDIQILPFRGEYYKLKKEKEYLVNNLIYPVPNPNFPFLGVHFTRMIQGGIEAGPNAVLAYAREGYDSKTVVWKELWETISHRGFQKVAAKYWRDGLYELYRSYSKSAFTRALQRFIPELKEEDLVPGGSGVRAQACDSKGNLLDDFHIVQGENHIHVCNAPSPAATSSLSIGNVVADMVLYKFK